MGVPSTRPKKAAIATAMGRHDNHAQLELKKADVPMRFQGLSGLVSNATVYAPMA